MTCEFREGAHQCAVFPAGDQGATHRAFDNCATNPGHVNFLTVKEFRERGQPTSFGTDGDQARIWNNIHKTVRVVVSYTSPRRPDTYLNSDMPYPLKEYRGNKEKIRYGTGLLYKKTDMFLPPSCLCSYCRDHPTQIAKYFAYFNILTATHVLFDDLEARHAKFEFFYDSEDNPEMVETIYGIRVRESENQRLETDNCRVLCVTHDRRLAERLTNINKLQLYEQPYVLPGTSGVLISHPHGVAKRISFGQYTEFKRIVINKHECPTTMKKGLKIRISGSQARDDLLQILGQRRDGHLRRLIQIGGSDTFSLLRDVTILHPLRMHVECDISHDWNIVPVMWEDPEVKDAWWTLPPGIKFLTEKGEFFNLPLNPDLMKIEAYVEGSLFESPFFSTGDYNPSPAFQFRKEFYFYCGYNMASCSGSSGAMALVRLNFPTRKSQFAAATHFGCHANTNWSSLLRPIIYLLRREPDYEELRKAQPRRRSRREVLWRRLKSVVTIRFPGMPRN